MTQAPTSQRLRPFKPQRFGRYTLLMPLSTGGMGEVFLAQLEGSHGFDKPCVIKKILPHLAKEPGFVSRFADEGRILVKLSHGNIAQVLDMGVHDEAPYIALEFIDGKDLRRVLARTRERQLPLPLSFVLSVMTRVLDALAYAHRKRGDDDRELNIVHRDLSPQNILISYEGEVKVIDFGLAKSSMSEANTNPSILLGKFMYMAPEQARHKPVDRRSDLYALGLCLWELVTGKSPFEGVPSGELIAKVGNPGIPALNTVDPLCPRALSEAVVKALQVDPAQRFQTAEEFRGALQSILQAIDPAAGAESTSRFMRDAFATEYQQERRMLAQVKEHAKALEPPAGAEEETLQGARSPFGKPLFLSGNEPTPLAGRALELKPTALSFAPTPKTVQLNGDDDGKPSVHEKETMPAIQLKVDVSKTQGNGAALPHEGTPTQGAGAVLAVAAPEEAKVEPPKPAVVVHEVVAQATPEPEALPSIVLEGIDSAPEPAPAQKPSAPEFKPTKKKPGVKISPRKTGSKAKPPAESPPPPPMRSGETMIVRVPVSGTLRVPESAPAKKKGGGFVWVLVPLLAVGAVAGFIAWDRHLEQQRAQSEEDSVEVDEAPPPPVAPKKKPVVEEPPPPQPPPEEPVKVTPTAVPEVPEPPAGEPKKRTTPAAPKQPAGASPGAVALKALEADFSQLVDEGAARKFRIRLNALKDQVGAQGADAAYVTRVKALHGEVKAALAAQQ